VQPGLSPRSPLTDAGTRGHPIVVIFTVRYHGDYGRWRTNAPDLRLRTFGQGRILVVPDFGDPEQAAKDHGHLMDEGVAEVEREADEAAGAHDHEQADKTAVPPSPSDRPTGAAAFSEAQVAEDDSESQKTENSPSEPTGSNKGSDERATELLVEQIAEAEDSVT
jgi:hypothetical protein